MFSLVVAFKVFPRPFLIFRYWYDASKFLDAASCFSLDPPRTVWCCQGNRGNANFSAFLKNVPRAQNLTIPPVCAPSAHTTVQHRTFVSCLFCFGGCEVEIGPNTCTNANNKESQNGTLSSLHPQFPSPCPIETVRVTRCILLRIRSS